MIPELPWLWLGTKLSYETKIASQVSVNQYGKLWLLININSADWKCISLACIIPHSEYSTNLFDS